MKKKMLKNGHVIGIAISLLIIISIFSTIVLAERNELKNNGINTIIFNDELDQSQTNIDYWIYMESSTHLAQSFVPQLTNLTRVELFLTKDPGYPPSLPFELAIRDSLTGINLAHKSVNSEQIPFYPYGDWIEFDFDDISMTTGQSYYIIVYTDGDGAYMWGCAEDNPYPYGMMYESTDGGYNWNSLPPSMDACFKTYGYGGGGADLTCDGSLSWTDVQSGSIVEGSFIIENIGDPGTLLDWEIESYPNWGTWTFNPENGEGLTPEDDPITVNVKVIAPDEQEETFTGEVVLVNSEDPDDTCVIDVSLATPVNQQVDIYPLFQRILERFPNAFPILRYLLELRLLKNSGIAEFFHITDQINSTSKPQICFL